MTDEYIDPAIPDKIPAVVQEPGLPPDWRTMMWVNSFLDTITQVGDRYRARLGDRIALGEYPTFTEAIAAVDKARNV